MPKKSKSNSKKQSTNKNSRSTKINKNSHFPKWAVVVVVSVIALIGIYFVYDSFAYGKDVEENQRINSQGTPTQVDIERDRGKAGPPVGYQNSTNSVNRRVNSDTPRTGGSGGSSSGGGGKSTLANLMYHWGGVVNCESSGNFSINTGNGYYGGLQFDIGTWRSVGGSGLPSDASALEQLQRAEQLRQSRGLSPWPNCGRYYRY